MLKLVAVGAERTELVIDVRKPPIVPFATPDNVYLVADGDELEWVRRNIAGIPLPANNHSFDRFIWVGDIARTIAAAITCYHG